MTQVMRKLHNGKPSAALFNGGKFCYRFVMRATTIYADENGITHFSDYEIALESAGEIGRLSKPMPGNGTIFRETEETYDYGWHCAPQRQWVVLLDGEIEIETGDGERRRFCGGEILRLLDVDGKGHRTRQISAGIRRSIFIPF